MRSVLKGILPEEVYLPGMDTASPLSGHYLLARYSEVSLLIRDFWFWRGYERVHLVLKKVDLPEEVQMVTEEDFWASFLHQALACIPWGHLLDAGETFACRCQVVPRNILSVSRMDVERIAGAILLRHHPGLRVNLTQPRWVVRLLFFPGKLYITIDLTGTEAMHRRHYRKYAHPSALNPVLAHWMSVLSLFFWYQKNSRHPRVIVDPVSGGGTLLIEFAHLLWGVPAMYWRREEFQDRVRWLLRINGILSARIDFPRFPQRSWVPLCLVAGDNSPRHLRNARYNYKEAGVQAVVLPVLRDIVRTSGHRWGQVFADLLLANPPYGIRLGNPRKAWKVHQALWHVTEKILRSGGIFTLITARTQQVEREFAQETGSSYLQLVARLRTYSGNLPAGIYVWRKE